MTDSATLYVTTTKLRADLRSEAETVRVHHPSMASLLAYLEYHNLLHGPADDGLPYFEVEHADGSRLSSEEWLRIGEVSNLAAWHRRQREVTRPRAKEALR